MSRPHLIVMQFIFDCHRPALYPSGSPPSAHEALHEIVGPFETLETLIHASTDTRSS